MSSAAEDIWRILREVAESQKQAEEKYEKQHQKALREMEELREQNKETDRRFKETERLLKEVTANIGKLGNRLGDFIEESVRPAAARLFRERGIEVHEVHQNIRSQRGNEGLELDLLVINDDEAVAIECKSNLSIDDVNEHLKRLAKLKRLLPSYAHKRIYGAVAAMVIPDNVAEYAYRKGLYVIGQNGEDLEIRNSLDFVARTY